MNHLKESHLVISNQSFNFYKDAKMFIIKKLFNIKFKINTQFSFYISSQLLSYFISSFLNGPPCWAKMHKNNLQRSTNSWQSLLNSIPDINLLITFGNSTFMIHFGYSKWSYYDHVPLSCLPFTICGALYR